MSALQPGQPVRVASVPHNQVYIRHLEDFSSTSNSPVFRLSDPAPDGSARSAESGWWPPAMLSAQWVDANHESFDLMHIHFGFDAIDPAQMGELIAQLRHHAKPLVYTVHDLINPHQPDPGAHRDLLDVLIPHADKLITLTAGAAREIKERWGADAQVLPHPHVVDFDSMERIRALRETSLQESTSKAAPKIGVHLKGLRPNMDPRILDPLAAIVAQLPGAVLQVNIHAQVLDPASTEYRGDLAQKLHAGVIDEQWELHAHQYFSEQELFAYLASMDVNVLPYHFGTHSGWLEAALDVGTRVAAPDCGYYTDQDPSVAMFRLGEQGPNEESLKDAIQTLLAQPGLAGMDASGRQEQRRKLARAHQEIYATLLERS